ncbi:MAG: hypothetical protein AAFV07_12640 [Bacteroidota bacterium]
MLKILQNVGRVLLAILWVAILTILTQVGGLLWLIWLPIGRRLTPKVQGWRRWWARFGMSLGFYLLCTLLVIPPLARLEGRVALPLSPWGNITPLSLVYPLGNRHYVRPALRDMLIRQQAELDKQYPGARIAYLDANFPFLDGFPLLPHRSHDDGRKVDLAFLYADQDGSYRARRAPTWLGYASYEGPRKGERDQPARCAAQGYWQYSIMDVFTPGASRWQVDVPRTKQMLRLLARDKASGKLFLEPHLKARWGLKHSKIRFHGCPAVRHDDHVHVQL